MALISLRQLLDHAADYDDGVPAFNIINANELPQIHGVPVEEIEKGIRHGVRKVNIDTDCRMAITGQMRKLAREIPAEFDSRKFALAGWTATRELCRDRFERFGTAGKASKIKVIPLAQMAERYRNHELEPRIGGHDRAAQN